MKLVDFLSYRGEKGRRQFSVAFLNRKLLAVGIDPIQEIV
jgi:hypothetical protein